MFCNGARSKIRGQFFGLVFMQTADHFLLGRPVGSLQFMLPHGEPVVCGDFAGLHAAPQLLRKSDVPPLGPAPPS